MLVFKIKKDIIQFIDNQRIAGKKIGFVPTMGALHDGHLALIKASNLMQNLTICSIYINPTQFNNPEDHRLYPKTINSDIEKLKDIGCHAAFIPDDLEMYGEKNNTDTTIHFGYLETICEGKFRTGHFRGVGLIVAKLFNIIKPDYAFFGQKDLQQFAVINQLVNDLEFSIKLRLVPTVRETDGLAMSSRNARILPGDRPRATIFYDALQASEKYVLQGQPLDMIKKTIATMFEGDPVCRLEYVEFVDPDTFLPVMDNNNQNYIAACIAGYVRNIRLIDNIIIKL